MFLLIGMTLVATSIPRIHTQTLTNYFDTFQNHFQFQPDFISDFIWYVSVEDDKGYQLPITHLMLLSRY